MLGLTDTPFAQTWCSIYDTNVLQRYEHINLKHVRVVNVAFGKIVANSDQTQFSIAFDDKYEKIVPELMGRVKLTNPLAKFYLTVGGDGSSNSYGGAANDRNFPLRVAKFLEERGFSGYDNDWEEGLDRTNLTTLCQNMDSDLRKHGFGSTICVWPQGDPAYNAEQSPLLDELKMMTYGPYVTVEDSRDLFTGLGFSLAQLGACIISENSPSVDTLGPDGSIVHKANVIRNSNMRSGSNWITTDDSCSTENPNIPTCARGILFNQTLMGGTKVESVSFTKEQKTEIKRLHDKACKNLVGPYTAYRAKFRH